MTDYEKDIVDAIWGDAGPQSETPEEVQQIVDGVVAMAEHMRRKSEQGQTVVYDAPYGLQ